MEAAGWERAHGYASNEHLLEKFGNRVPVREHEWDNRHFWRVSNAEHLQISEDVGMVNLSHFAIIDVTGADAEALMEYVSVDLTIIRMAENHYRVMDGGDSGARDLVWLQRMRDDRKLNATIQDRTTEFSCLGLWGPNARTTLQKVVSDADAVTHENHPYMSVKTIEINGVKVAAFRISYVGEQGWELHFNYDDGLTVWDALAAEGVTPIGVETYANSRRLEKSLRLQNADLLTEYNLLEADLARPKVKAANFHGKEAYLAHRALDHQIAYLCTFTLTDNKDSNGIARYPVGICPIIDPNTNDTIVDEKGRRSYTTSIGQ